MGGAVEIGDTEVALDDVWALELTARPKWRKVADLSPEVTEAVAGDAVLSSDDEEEEEKERRRRSGGAKKRENGGDNEDEEEEDDDSD